MKRHRFIEPICITCLIETARSFVELSERDINLQFRKLLALVHNIESMFKGDLSSYMELSKRFYDACIRILGDFKYFDEIKHKSNELALKLAPIAERYVSLATSIDDKLKRAIKVSLIGNALDFGTGVYKVSLDWFKQKFHNLLDCEIALDESNKLLSYIYNSEKILYVLDNAGEIVFDKLLIKEIKSLRKEVIAVTRGRRVQNDVTLYDAKCVKLESIVKVITTGSGIAGILLRDCSKEFLEQLKNADLVILKGQGNYQSIDEILRVRKEGIAFLLKVKCEPVAKDLRVCVRDFVVKVY